MWASAWILRDRCQDNRDTGQQTLNDACFPLGPERTVMYVQEIMNKLDRALHELLASHLKAALFFERL